jgi:hypothetical protein
LASGYCDWLARLSSIPAAQRPSPQDLSRASETVSFIVMVIYFIFIFSLSQYRR